MEIDDVVVDASHPSVEFLEQRRHHSIIMANVATDGWAPLLADVTQDLVRKEGWRSLHGHVLLPWQQPSRGTRQRRTQQLRGCGEEGRAIAAEEQERRRCESPPSLGLESVRVVGVDFPDDG